MPRGCRSVWLDARKVAGQLSAVDQVHVLQRERCLQAIRRQHRAAVGANAKILTLPTRDNGQRLNGGENTAGKRTAGRKTAVVVVPDVSVDDLRHIEIALRRRNERGDVAAEKTSDAECEPLLERLRREAVSRCLANCAAPPRPPTTPNARHGCWRQLFRRQPLRRQPLAANLGAPLQHGEHTFKC